MTRSRKQVFRHTEPSEKALLAWLRPQITSEMLERIAQSDYRKDVWDHLKGIEQQLSESPKRGLLPWCPREVLELERWNGAEQREELEGGIPSHRRVSHLLACLLLLLSAATILSVERLSEEAFFVETSLSTLILFAESAIALGPDCTDHSLNFLAWFMDSVKDPRLYPFTEFCAFLLWLEQDGTRSCKEIGSAWTELLDEEAHAKQAFADDLASGRWLLGLSVYPQSWKWRQVAERTIERAMHCPEQATAILSFLKAEWLS